MHLAVIGSLDVNNRFPKQAPVNAIRLLPDLGETFIDVWWYRESGVPVSLTPEAIAFWLDAFDYITTRVHDGWSILSSPLIRVFTPSYLHLELIRACLERGLNPNGTASAESLMSLLDIAFVEVSSVKMDELESEAKMNKVEHMQTD